MNALGFYIALFVLIGFEKKYWILRPDHSVLKRKQKHVNKILYTNDVLAGLYVDDGLLAIRRVFVKQAREKARISPLPLLRKLGVMHSLSRPLTFTDYIVVDSFY